MADSRLVLESLVFRLIASGRASDIYDLGDGRVLRRFKEGGDPEREALVMRHAGASGYPVPKVLEVKSDSLVLERIQGPTMVEAIRGRMSTLERSASVLADLHKHLHEIGPPPAMTSQGPGDRLLHLDLHPNNVIVSETGPVVVDWTNADSGDPALDVALTWVILATAVGDAARHFVESFLSHFDLDQVRGALPAAAEFRMRDSHVADREREEVGLLLARYA
jgi:aminoglycoside phosphotransferase (APT) family kinase protein